jgi:death-on-curing protein
LIEDEGWLYLEPADVRELLAQWTEPIEYPGKLEGACGYPRQSFGGEDRFTTAAEKAGALAFAISGVYHPFYDGNKRAGALAALHFTYVNGYDLVLTPGELLAIFAQIARGHMTQPEVISFFESRITLMGRGPDE